MKDKIKADLQKAIEENLSQIRQRLNYGKDSIGMSIAEIEAMIEKVLKANAGEE